MKEMGHQAARDDLGITTGISKSGQSVGVAAASPSRYKIVDIPAAEDQQLPISRREEFARRNLASVHRRAPYYYKSSAQAA